jgi:hypothetical protein
VDLLAQIDLLEPGFVDPDGLLKVAEPRLAELQRQARLQELYESAMRDVDAGAWDEARSLLGRLQSMEPGFQDVEQLLAKVDAQIRIQEAEERRQAELGERYALAQAAEGTGDWVTAIAVLESLVTEAPDYKDAAARLKAVELELERESQRQASKPRTLPSDRPGPKKPLTLPDDVPKRRPGKPPSLPS